MALDADEILHRDGHAPEGQGEIGRLRVGQGALEVVGEVAADVAILFVDGGGEGLHGFRGREVSGAVGVAELGDGEFGCGHDARRSGEMSGWTGDAPGVEQSLTR